VARWVAETPSGFRFFVKLNKVSTHERTGEGEETAELLAAVAPLLEEGRLAGLLAQFPASFHAGPREREYLTVLAERLATLPLFVELRHRSWDSDESVELLRRLKVGWVAVDQPRLPSLGGPRPAVAGQAGYVRFHGRNSATWYNPDRGDRYDWDYSQRELEEWVPRLEAMEARAEMNYLFFNNCHMGQAVKSAMKMRTLLSQQFEIL
jgi:uncharacterized protein YecE (DUF72 family)